MTVSWLILSSSLRISLTNQLAFVRLSPRTLRQVWRSPGSHRDDGPTHGEVTWVRLCEVRGSRRSQQSAGCEAACHRWEDGRCEAVQPEHEGAGAYCFVLFLSSLRRRHLLSPNYAIFQSLESESWTSTEKTSFLHLLISYEVLC